RIRKPGFAPGFLLCGFCVARPASAPEWSGLARTCERAFVDPYPLIIRTEPGAPLLTGCANLATLWHLTLFESATTLGKSGEAVKRGLRRCRPGESRAVRKPGPVAMRNFEYHAM